MIVRQYIVICGQEENSVVQSQVKNVEKPKGDSVHVRDLSPLGHQALDLMRDESRWTKKLKPILAKLGDCSLPILLQALSEKVF